MMDETVGLIFFLQEAIEITERRNLEQLYCF